MAEREEMDDSLYGNRRNQDPIRGLRSPRKLSNLWVRIQSYLNGGEGGIRTPVTLARKADFESAAFDHSATSPGRNTYSIVTTPTNLIL